VVGPLRFCGKTRMTPFAGKPSLRSMLIPFGLAGYVAQTGSSGWIKALGGLAALTTAMLLAGYASRR
jgi:hypothetical protein